MKKLCVCNYVRDNRLVLGLTQRQLAEFCGVSKNTISAIENGVHSPSLLLAFKLAVAMDLDLEDLFRLSVTPECSDMFPIKNFYKVR